MSLEGNVMLELAPPEYRKSRVRYNEHPALSLISELIGNILTSQVEGDSIPEENMLTDSDEESHEGDDDSEPRIRNEFDAIASCLGNEE